MKIRTIPEAVKELREQDPKSCVGYWTIRNLIDAGTLPAIKAGKKYLVDLDRLETLFVGEEKEVAT